MRKIDPPLVSYDNFLSARLTKSKKNVDLCFMNVVEILRIPLSDLEDLKEAIKKIEMELEAGNA